MSILDWLSAGANVPFAIALGATLLFAALQVSGVLGLLGGGGDAEGDADVEGDAAADGDADAEADADGDAEADGDADGEGDSPSLATALLAPLAIGRVPLTLTAEVFGITFAVAGLAMNTVWIRDGAVPLVTLAWTLPAGAVAGYGISALVARVVAPIVDDRPHAATSRQQMIGAIGVVISSKVSAEFGEVRIRDRSGHDVRVVCRLAPRCRVIAEQEEAVVVDVDERGTLFVAPLDAPR